MASRFQEHRQHRREQRQDELAERLRSADTDVRRAVVVDFPWVEDTAWARSQLLDMIDGEPELDVHVHAVVALSQLLAREPEQLAALERALCSGLDAPGRLLDAWLAWREEQRLDGPRQHPGWADAHELHEQLAAEQIVLREAGWTPAGPPGAAETGLDRSAVLVGALAPLTITLRRYVRSPDWNRAHRRATVLTVLEHARGCPAGSRDRAAALAGLLPDRTRPAWTDGLDALVAVDEALAVSGDEQRLALDVLRTLLAPGDVARVAAIRRFLDTVAAEERQDPGALAAAAEIYGLLARARGLTDPPVAKLLELLACPDPRVRAAAAGGVGHFDLAAPDQPVVVTVLTPMAVADQDPAVRAAAAGALARLRLPDGVLLSSVHDTLRRHRDSADPAIRAACLRRPLDAGDPEAVSRLARELGDAERAEPFVRILADMARTGIDWDPVVAGPATEVFEALDGLARSGWGERHGAAAELDAARAGVAEAATADTVHAP